MSGHALRDEASTASTSPSTAVEERDATGRLKHKGNCYLCPKRRSTRKACGNCKKPVCLQHSTGVINCSRCKDL